jgi:RNA polymerase sigma factor (sigma-70 family)
MPPKDPNWRQRETVSGDAPVTDTNVNHSATPHCSCTRHQPLCDTCRALSDLVPRVRRLLRRFARSYGLFPSRDDLAELTQEVLAGLAISRHPPNGYGGFVACVARRRLIDWLRRSISRPHQDPAGARIDEEPTRPMLSDLALGIREAMERMSESQRIVFAARGIDGLSRLETAHILGLSEGTIQYHYMRAIAIVAEVLEIDFS